MATGKSKPKPKSSSWACQLPFMFISHEASNSIRSEAELPEHWVVLSILQVNIQNALSIRTDERWRLAICFRAYLIIYTIYNVTVALSCARLVHPGPRTECEAERVGRPVVPIFLVTSPALTNSCYAENSTALGGCKCCHSPYQDIRPPIRSTFYSIGNNVRAFSQNNA